MINTPKIHDFPDLSSEALNKLDAMLLPGQTREQFIQQLVDKEHSRRQLPDARNDLAGAVNESLGLQLETKKRIDALYAEATVTIKDIAEKQGMDVSLLYRSPWMLPSFGVPDFGKSPKRWKLSTYENWMLISEAYRREQWELLPDDARKRILSA